MPTDKYTLEVRSLEPGAFIVDLYGQNILTLDQQRLCNVSFEIVNG
jgi:hypothetical protein